MHMLALAGNRMSAPTPLEVKLALVKMTQLLDEERAQHEATKSTLDQAGEKVYWLKNAITYAPHGPNCSSLIPVPEPPRYPCNCWKKEVSA
jgi:hypothetical protein